VACWGQRPCAGWGQVVLLDAASRTIHQRFEGWSSQGFRVLGLAAKPVRPDPYTPSDERDLIFSDSSCFRSAEVDVQDTLADLSGLGFNKIISGDNLQVTQYIAKQVGLAVTGVLTGAVARTAMNSHAIGPRCLSK
jgi:magnesium-transporting ATPase (P-type)